MIVNSYLLTLSALILGASYLFRRLQRKQRRMGQELPMADLKQASWIWGHEFKIFQHEACEMYIEWAASLGPMYRVKAALFQPEIIIVGDNSAARHILQNCYTSYVKAPAFQGLLRSHLGNGLATVEGEEHKYQRRLLAPAFTSGAVEAMADDIFSCVDKMTQNLRSALIDTGETNDTGVVDMVPIMSACTLDIIGRVGFGHDFECGKSTEAKAIISAWHQDVVKLQTFAGFMAPILINVFPWITRLPIPAFQDGIIKRIVYRLAGKLVSANSNNMNASGNDILSLLLKSDQNTEDKSEPRFTTTELLDNVLNYHSLVCQTEFTTYYSSRTMYRLAGHETSAITVDFILLNLAQNPKIQRKLQQEIRTIPSLDYNSIVGLEYLEAVVKEGLRLHPVEGLTERMALQDDVIPLKHAIHTESGEIVSSFAVKAGQVLRVPWFVLNINKQVWGNNASEFIPERWIEPGGVPPLDELPHGPWGEYLHFVPDGPRSCIGYRLAVLELKIIIAVLVRSFEFECTEVKIVQRLSPSLQPFADGKAGSMPLKVSLAEL
ncbi:cytochrome P450 [Rhodocollybia butyracea]|uniref:Cytochrome P450 n=1 Tax=Rhodocollybia butyracea TaxID=206335 RepID=A0A9P5PPP6_9AGAR|nr:cytochrome P450 [Rhodocollybia butyracea]